MPLTFKTSDLIKIIDQIITAHDASEHRYAHDCAVARTEYQENWYNEHVDNVRALRDYLTRCLKAGRPPHSDEAAKIMGVEPGYRSAISFFTPGGDGSVKRKFSGFYQLGELKSLSALLKAHQGDTVTAHQLKELGTHPKDLEKLFRTAVTAGAVV